jgi:hypothetical protein
MSDGGTFNRLAFELSLDERKNLLEKLNSQSNISKAPLYGEVEDGPTVDITEQYLMLPWYYRLWFFILSVVKSKTPVRIFEDREVVKLGRIIDAQTPGLYDYGRGLLLQEFYKELTALKEGSRFFFTALDASVNRDKGAFYAFLGSLEMGEVHKRLTAATDPDHIADQHPAAAESELRQIAFRAMEDTMGMITDGQRNSMYANARSLNCLRQLSSFLFDRVILAFAMDQSAGGMACAGIVIKEQLAILNNILYSLREIPSMTLLESLFIFILQDRVGEAGFDINAEMRKLLSRADSALAAIRAFNQQVPLTLILRCAGRDMAFSPKALSGGEEWFVVYRDHWKHRIETQFSDFLRHRRQQNLLNAFHQFFKGTNLKLLDHVESESNPEGMPIQGTYLLSFLLTFHAVVFVPDINTYLRPVLIDGEFYRRENRTEFTECYNDLMKIEDSIRRFDTNLSPIGDYGKRYTQARGEMSSLPVKRRKIQIVVEEADDEAAAIIERSRNAINGMINILGGVLKKETGGKYESLTNLPALAGKGDVFINGLNDSLVRFQQALHIMAEIELMESGK